jgi:hypothetical protein
MSTLTGKQIIALGGGGFSMEPDNLKLDTYILEAAKKKKPKICFLPTASGDSDSYIKRFYESFGKLEARPTHFSVFAPPTNDFDSFFLELDIVYVGGGNTRNMLTLWRDWGIDKLLKSAWERGTILTGISAGAICWFEQGLTDSNPGTLSGLNCLGFLPGSCSPHYNSEKERRPKFNQLITTKVIRPGYGIDDSCALHFVGDRMIKIISSVRNCHAYFVDQKNERRLEAVLL